MGGEGAEPFQGAAEGFDAQRRKALEIHAMRPTALPQRVQRVVVDEHIGVRQVLGEPQRIGQGPPGRWVLKPFGGREVLFDRPKDSVRTYRFR